MTEPAEFQDPASIPTEPPDEVRRRNRLYWPEGTPMPLSYAPRTPRRWPCPRCWRVQDHTWREVVICLGTDDEVAHLACRACEHRWTLPLER